jgi:hypothetical protein
MTGFLPVPSPKSQVPSPKSQVRFLSVPGPKSQVPDLSEPGAAGCGPTTAWRFYGVRTDWVFSACRNVILQLSGGYVVETFIKEAVKGSS